VGLSLWLVFLFRLIRGQIDDQSFGVKGGIAFKGLPVYRNLELGAAASAGLVP